MDKFKKIFKKEHENEDKKTSSYEKYFHLEKNNELKKGKKHKLYVIPLFLEQNEIALIEHSPEKWHKKEGVKFMTFFNKDYDDTDLTWDKIKEIMEENGYVLRKNIKYDSMQPLYKNNNTDGTINACILYLSFFDYDEIKVDNKKIYLTKKENLLKNLFFPDVYSIIVSYFILST